MRETVLIFIEKLVIYHAIYYHFFFFSFLIYIFSFLNVEYLFA